MPLEQTALRLPDARPVLYLLPTHLDAFRPARMPRQDPRQLDLLTMLLRPRRAPAQRHRQTTLEDLLTSRGLSSQRPKGPPVQLMRNVSRMPANPTIDDLGPAVRPRRGKGTGLRPQSVVNGKMLARERAFVDATARILAEYEDQRPVVRADCQSGGVNEHRPCPWMSCKHHMAINVNPDNGSLQFVWPGVELHEMPATCALDVADEQEERNVPQDFVALGRLLNMDDTGSRKQVLRYEDKLRAGVIAAGIGSGDE
jgi:hypothetical protein